jgi:probable phosphoglycerate mutase
VRNIYVVTHPQASHHVEGIVGGWHDSTLTDLGERQAQAIADELARRLDGAGDVEIVTSDLQRARRTAEVVQARTRGRLRRDPDLREKSSGTAEGLPTAWLKERQTPLPDQGERLRQNEGIAGAETRWDVAQRAYAATTRLLTSEADNQIVVTHGGTATLLLAAWIEMPIDATGRVQFGVSPGGIKLLTKNPRNHSHTIARLNDVDHLALADSTTPR